MAIRRFGGAGAAGSQRRQPLLTGFPRAMRKKLCQVVF
jgi:hypothetical protein